GGTRALRPRDPGAERPERRRQAAAPRRQRRQILRDLSEGPSQTSGRVFPGSSKRQADSMNGSTFTTSPDDRYFEDYVTGSVHEFGSVVAEEQGILDFGKRCFPLSDHTDLRPSHTR